MASFPIPWFIRGDFNTVCDSSERIGVSCNMGSMRNFNSFILRANEVDLPMNGSAFTWTNSRDKAAWARLDRFLVSPIMLSWFPNWSLRCLPRSVSDHCPILLGESKQDWGPIPFRFFNHWLEYNNMMKDVVEGWKRCSPKGAAGSSLAAKVKETKPD
ncbi:hypothetical protein Dsin_022486 [Dipteronia sinensis]|uniref:Endonuclease/exonuclease/phosphatase domain-containing protein n=1 Tax=Dipteronia sinensis TaxID=43782 RepID=A0AAE0A328_9ROSI|nr:hypothetical protein Dsin_022486 [Dipteronia sinensis]